MKVNMALISGEGSGIPDEERPVPAVEDLPEGQGAGEEEEEEELDESGKHSKLKTLFFVAIMVGGFGLFVWNMTGLVNNMRLEGQGEAVNVVYEMEEIDDFMDYADGSGSEPATEENGTKSEVSMDAARDGPGSEEEPESAGDDTEIEKKLQDALNEAALVKQELKNAEDMLDSSLQREAELQNKLDALGEG